MAKALTGLDDREMYAEVAQEQKEMEKLLKKKKENKKNANSKAKVVQLP